LVCSGVGLAAEPLEIRTAIRTRRSWVSMSSKAGSVLPWYQGWAWRRAVMPARWWPCRAYHTTINVQVSRANGTVRSTARRVRLRASPAPGMLRASPAPGMLRASAKGLLDGPAGGVPGD